MERLGVYGTAVMGWQRTSCAGIGDDGCRIPQVECGAHGRTDTHMGHESGDDQFFAPRFVDFVLKCRLGEGVGQRLGDQGFPVLGGDFVGQLSAGTLQVEGATLTALVDHMEDGRTGGAGAFQNFRSFFQRCLNARQGEHAGKVFVLLVDGDDHGFGQSSGREVGSGHLEQGLGLRHHWFSVNVLKAVFHGANAEEMLFSAELVCKNADMNLNWDDIRYLLAIRHEGTLTAAAQSLGVNQTTAARRLAAAEEALGVRLFDRIRGRFKPTEDGLIALERAEAVERAVLDMENAVTDKDGALEGLVRLTAVDMFLADFLVPRLAGFRATFPGIALELIAGNANLDLARREADLAVRLARPRSGDVMARKLAEVGFAVYGTEDFAGRDLKEAPWILYDGGQDALPENRRAGEAVGSRNVSLRISAGRAYRAALLEGLGVGMLPCYFGDKSEGLVRLSGLEPLVHREMWLLSHKEMRRTARAEAVVNWLIETVKTEGQALRG